MNMQKKNAWSFNQCLPERITYKFSTILPGINARMCHFEMKTHIVKYDLI
jgi:hypothetical protein